MRTSEPLPTQSASLPGLSVELTMVGVIPRSLERALLLANLLLSAVLVALATAPLLALLFCGVHMLLQVLSALPLRVRNLQRHTLREFLRLIADAALLLAMPLLIGADAPAWILALPLVFALPHALGYGPRTVLAIAGAASAGAGGILLAKGAAGLGDALLAIILIGSAGMLALVLGSQPGYPERSYTTALRRLEEEIAERERLQTELCHLQETLQHERIHGRPRPASMAG